MMGYDSPYGTGDRDFVTAVSQSTGLFAAYLPRLIDGAFDNNQYFNDGLDPAGRWLKFDFFESIVITEIKWYQSGAVTQGVWKVQGSNNDADWVDIGSSFTLGSPATQTITEVSGNTTAYRYYRLLGVSGVTSWNAYSHEIEFSWAYTVGSPAYLTSTTKPYLFI